MSIKKDKGREMTRKKKTGNFILVVLFLLFTGLYISLVFNKNVWTDEAYTIQLVRENNFVGIVKNTAIDVHPPLYYLIVKMITFVFGDSICVYKIVSVIPMLLTMLFAFFCVKSWWGKQAAVTFLIMVNAIPCVLEYVVQIRMYSWAMFFVTWAGLGAYGLCRKKQTKYGTWLAVASLFACYTHTYAMVSCVCIYFLVCIDLLCGVKGKKKLRLLKQVLLSGGIVAICYLPWLVVLIRQTTDRIDNYWIEPITGQEIAQYFSFLFASQVPYSTALYLILCGLAVVTCIYRSFKKDKDATAALLMLGVPLLTAGIGIVISILVTPFFIARYLVPCMGLLAIFFAMAFRKKSKYVQGLLAVFGIGMVCYSYQQNFLAEYKSTHTEELLAFMDDNMENEDVIVYNYEVYGFIYRIYFDGNRVKFLNDVDFSENVATLWYFDSCVTPWLDSQVLEQYGWKKEYIMTTGIEHNEFHLYKIEK